MTMSSRARDRRRGIDVPTAAGKKEPPMTIRANVRNGAPCWVDLMSSDVDKSKAFYGELFGWTADEPNPDFGGYTNLRKDGEQVAGLMTAQEAGVADVWCVYLAVEDAAK